MTHRGFQINPLLSPFSFAGRSYYRHHVSLPCTNTTTRCTCPFPLQFQNALTWQRNASSFKNDIRFITKSNFHTTTFINFSMSHPNFFEKSFQQLDSIITKVEASLPKKQQNESKNISKPQRQKQPKGRAPTAIPYSSNEDVARFQKTNIQVAKILEATKLENSEKLFLMKLETSEGQKTLVGGLQQYYQAEDLIGKLVCAILNLKPAKLAGVLSEAMLLAGSTQDGENITVKLLEPPRGSNVGDRIFVVENHENLEANILPPADQVNAKQWKTAVSLLQVKGGHATYAGMTLRTVNGDVSCPLPDGSEIH